MTDLPLSVLAEPLLSVAQAVWPYLRRVRKERQAGRMPFTESGNLMDKCLYETLSRLCRGSVDESWWRTVLGCIEHRYVAPDFLRSPALQDWLARDAVRTDAKALARARIMGADSDSEDVKERLRATYSECTGEDTRLADGPIEVVIAVFAAGYFAEMSSGEKAIAAMVQAHSQQVEARFDAIESLLGQAGGPDPQASEIYNEHVRNNLTRILKRRSLDPDAAREEIRALAQRVVDGNLSHADSVVQADVLYWAARIHAIFPETRDVTIEYRRQLLQLRPKRDIRIIDVLLRESAGDIDGALRALRDIDDPDGHTVLFLFLRRTRGHKAAVLWFDEQAFQLDAKAFTGLGWSQIAVALAQEGRWDEAVDCLTAARDQADEWPELSVIAGMVCAAMLLPVDLRWNALTTGFSPPERETLEDAIADRYRSIASERLARAEEQLVAIGADIRLQAVRYVRLWLRLTDPMPSVAAEAKREVEDGMQEMKRAVDLLPFALAFGIAFDGKRIGQHLAQREALSGLTNQELIAEFLLAEATLAPRELADYLEREDERLGKVITKAILIGKRIEGLVRDGELARARNLLEQRRADLDERLYDRFRMIIDAHAGEDIREQLEKFYRKTNSIEDLRNLVSHLGQVEDWSGLRPLLEELFGREPTVANAKRVVACMQRSQQVDDDQVLSFLNANDTLVERDSGLRSMKAWLLFQTGNWKQAKDINDELLLARTDDADLVLDMNLALQSGDWEHFSAIVDREWDRRTGHSPDTLMRLAMLAAETDKTSPKRAMDLAALAASKAPGDPKILISAYEIAVQLGQDDGADPGWLARAAELSGDSGPVMKIDLRTIIEKMMPASRERERRTNESLLRGEIPLSIAADILNVPLARVLLDLPKRNADQQDGRRIVIIPIFFGGRQPVELSAEWTVGFDITTVMVLEHLGLLEIALGAFRNVVLAPDTMMLLLNEHRRVRFHQPSRVRKAEDIRALINEGRLHDEVSLPEPPLWLSDEVGRDLAQLLEAARVNGGTVVHPGPIHRTSSFMEQEADLRDYADFIVTTKTFAGLMLAKRHIDTYAFERASSYLAVHDRGRDNDIDGAILQCPLYFDDLGINYIQEAGLLRHVCGCGLDLRAHPSVKKDLGALADATGEGERLAKTINKIRETLCGALKSGKAGFLPRDTKTDAATSETDLHRVAPTMSQFLGNNRPCDAVCIDDRFLNRHRTITDRSGRSVAIICVLDILRHLVSQGLIDATKKHEILHAMRKGGFAFAPVEPEELEARLNGARDEQGSFVESFELRTIRQVLARIRSLDMLQQPDETSFLDLLRLGCVIVIRRLWENETLPVDQTINMSDWLWQNVSPSPMDWGRTAQNRAAVMPPSDAFGLHIALLLKPMLLVKGERHKAFRDWVESEVIEPLLPANANLVDGAATRIKAETIEWSEKYGADENSTG